MGKVTISVEEIITLYDIDGVFDVIVSWYLEHIFGLIIISSLLDILYNFLVFSKSFMSIGFPLRSLLLYFLV